MEQKSKLLNTYKKSPFSNIGNKVSAIQNPKVPDDIKIDEYDTKSILEVQKDFDEIVVKPYGTVLSELSKVGSIKVNPTTSVLRLFSQLNDVVSPVVISNDTHLLSVTSVYSHIKQPDNADLLKYRILPFIDEPLKTSILDKTIPNIRNITINNDLIYSNTQTVNEFNTLNILNLDSTFDDIVQFKTTSVLDEKIPFETVTDLPYSNVLELNSKFDDLVIKDVGSILKVYVASNVSETIPGIANFFADIYNTGFTLNAQQGQSLFKQDAIPEHRDTKINPEKTMVDIVPMSETPEKSIVDTNLIPQTPKKLGLDIVTPPETPEKIGVDVVTPPDGPAKTTIDVNKLPDTPEKPISDINPPAVTPEKLPEDLIPMGETPTKEGIIINLMPDTPEKPIATLRDIIDIPKEGRDPIPMPSTPEKDIAQLSEVDYIPNIDAKGFTANAQPLQTLFTYLRLPTVDYIPQTPDKRVQATEPTAVNFFPDDKATGFTINKGKLISEYNLTDGLESNYGDKSELDAFNWNIPPGYPGVLNQYAVYFSKYPPLTNVTYKTVIDWAYNQTIRVPEAQTLYNEGFHTPKIPVSEFQLIVPPYQYANDRLPTWANTYLSSLEDVGSTLVAGFLSQQTIDLLGTITGLDTSPMKQSTLAFHQLAGEIYWENNKLGTVVRNVREGAINILSDLVGNTLANVFIPTLENSIGGATANLVNSIVNATVLDSDKVLMLYHIMMGTKYTKSKAFFDKLTKTYSSKYGQIGDNALNLYNNETSYQKYLSGDSLNAFGYSIPSIPDSISTQVSSLTGNIPGLIIVGESDQDNSISQLKSTLYRVVNGRNDSLIPIGEYQPGLINRYKTKDDSWTFGQQVEPDKYYSVDGPLEQRVHQYDEPVLYTSIDKNYPTEEQIAKNPSLEVKTDLNALSNNSISDYTTALSSDLYMANNKLSTKATKENTYYSLMIQRLYEKGKLLDDKGFPSIKNQFSDDKNRLNMIKMPASDEEVIGTTPYEDNDLIDFFFEDLSSLSGTNASIVIPFRAILTNISDGTNANWSAQDYMGRADKFWIYQGFERRVAVQFDVAINSKDEFISSWNKINYLHGMCYPVEYPAQVALKAPIMALTIGNLFTRIQVILNSFNVSFDGNSLWEIEKGYQMPMYIKIQTDMTVIFDDIPLASKKHYAQNQDWITPRIYDYNETNIQNSDDLNILTQNDSGSIGTMKQTEFVAQLQNLGLVNPGGF